jgi:two-component system sensor histidine kinase SenX3
MSLIPSRTVEALRYELTQAERARDAALAEVSRLMAALDVAPVGLVIESGQRGVVLRNRAASLGGHSELIVQDAVDRMMAVARSGEVAEERVMLAGPPVRVLMVRSFPLPDQGALATIDDVTERHRLDSVRTDFVSNISHELKTPVGALALLAETMADCDDQATVRRLAERMIDEAQRAARTIDDLLDLSRIELGGRGDHAQTSVDSILREAVVRHRLTAESLGVDLVLDEPGPLMVVCDRLQVLSAVSNLIDNAVKYSNRGGVVRISASIDDQNLAIEVADNGIGIPQRDLDRIFERFYRVDRARSRETGGTGLGLAIVRHVATNHGGTVGVRSREGEGSVFTLSIPLEGC